MIIDAVSNNKDEHLSDKSLENMSRTEEIYEWVDDIPLSKTAKNYARDFSDAVLMAEILKFYYPQLVCSYNYIPANNVKAKKENWYTLNRKVLSKLDMRISGETINLLANSTIGTIEKVLAEFREKLTTQSMKGAPVAMDSRDESIDNPESIRGQEEIDEIPEQDQEQDQETDEFLTANESIQSSVVTQVAVHRPWYKCLWRSIVGFFVLVLSYLCFWRLLRRKPARESAQQRHTGERDFAKGVAGHSKGPELQGTDSQLVKSLVQKVAFLEHSVKLNDKRIASLMASQLECSNGDGSARLCSPHVSLVPKARKRPQTQM